MTAEEFKRDVLRLQPRLQRTAEKIIGDADSAEDAVQETVISLWEQRDQLHDAREMERLSLTIVKRRSIDQLRKLQPTVPIDAESLMLTETSDDSLEERYQLARKLVEQLPQRQRDAILMKYEEGMSNPDIEKAMQTLPMGESTTVRLPGEPKLFRVSHLSFPDRGYQHPFFLIESLTDEVRRAERAAYERVIRMMAHEVNNSVAGIAGSLSDVERERLLALSKFVTRFAEVVKLPRPQPLLCDLSEEVDACRPFLESLCTSSGITVGFSLADDAIPVQLDAVLFQQVLINIVKNSVESIAGRGGHISIVTAAVPAEGGEKEAGMLVISDNGHGISPEVSSQLFTPFFSTKPQGQGIGLLLIRDILTAHGCNFNLLTSPDDHLTRFTIHFPPTSLSHGIRAGGEALQKYRLTIPHSGSKGNDLAGSQNHE